MTDLPPLVRDQRRVDADHLRLLAIFHFVFAGLSVIGLCFLGLHYVFMHALIGSPGAWKHADNGGPNPEAFFAIFKWFYVVFGFALTTCGIGNLLSGLFILKRRNRMFSLVVAGLDCLQIPFGTVLGVFTLIVLLRDSIHELYGTGTSNEMRSQSSSNSQQNP
jgi:cytochrome c biogenesis protein CcdA